MTIVPTFQPHNQMIAPWPVNRKWSVGLGAALPTKSRFRKGSLGPPSKFIQLGSSQVILTSTRKPPKRNPVF